MEIETVSSRGRPRSLSSCTVRPRPRLTIRAGAQASACIGWLGRSCFSGPTMTGDLGNGQKERVGHLAHRHSHPSWAAARRKCAGAMPSGRRRYCAHGVRVQSAATAAGRADRRHLLPGGRAALPPADAAAESGSVPHREPRGAVPHPRRHRHRDGRVRRRLRCHHANPRIGVRLPARDPVSRRALQAVGAGAVPADACRRAVRPAGDAGRRLGPSGAAPPLLPCETSWPRRTDRTRC